jgi:hypothetical protein
MVDPLAIPVRICLLILLATRLCAAADFSKVPGVVIAHSPQSTGIYLGTPGIALVDHETYVAKCDEFGPKSTEKTHGLTRVFRSGDSGKTWRQIAAVRDLYWSNIFIHGGALYMSGVTRTYGDAVICKSTDNGATWSQPLDSSRGLLRRGRYHTSSMPIIIHAGRLWRAMETFDDSATDMWHAHRPVMLSIPVDADLLDARNWTLSRPAARDPGWLGGKWSTWLEGNAVISPQGTVIDLLRCDYRTGGHEKAMWVDVSDDGSSLRFDPTTGFVDLPGGCKKFNIRYDEKSRLYWSLANYVPRKHWDHAADRTRNTSALICSPDLRHWEACCALLYGSDIEHDGFQYADFAFDGDDLAAVYRTALDDGLGGAHNQHDSNFITFLRVRNFRTLKPIDSIATWLAEDLENYNAALRH